VAAMTLPGVPLWLLIGLLFVTELFAPPFDAARSATLAVVLPGDRFVVGAAASSVTFQAGQVAGFLVGGVLVATLGTQVSLGLDAATFAVSAVLLAVGLRGRPAPTAGTEQGQEGVWRSVVGGLRLVLGDPYLRSLLGLAWLAAYYVVPQGLAVPYAAELGGGATVVGLLLAAYPVGMSLGSIVFSRWVDPDRRLRLMGPLAVVACAVLVTCVARPGLAGSLILFGLSGAASAYQLAASATFVARVPDHMLGRAFGLAQAGLSIGQGVAVVLAGALAELVRPSTVVSGSGAIGVLAAVPLAVAWYRRQPSQP
jgi:predicted MFS family arabinose efflux permease